jgi:hypothetical protein
MLAFPFMGPTVIPAGWMFEAHLQREGSGDFIRTEIYARTPSLAEAMDLLVGFLEGQPFPPVKGGVPVSAEKIAEIGLKPREVRAIPPRK